MASTNQFDVTFEIITPESAECGDCAERGMHCQSDSLRDALESIDRQWNCHHVEPDSVPCERPRWLTFYNVNEGSRAYFEDGEEINFTLHIPENVTNASARRIARLVRAYGFDSK